MVCTSSIIASGSPSVILSVSASKKITFSLSATISILTDKSFSKTPLTLVIVVFMADKTAIFLSASLAVAETF